MEKEFRINTLEKKLQNCAAGSGIKIESTINELEVTDTTSVERIHLLQKTAQLKWPTRLVQGREAELTPEGAAA